MKKKTSMFAIALLAAALFGMTMQVFAQKVLPEIIITASNYKYLNAVNPEEAAQPVNMLEHYAASYDVKDASFYEEEYDNYIVSFYIPEGKLLAMYDSKGQLIHTAEKFKDVALPKSIREAIATRFPQWTVSKDVYIVSYYNSGRKVTKKIYKIRLENGSKRLRVKMTDNGQFLS